MENNIFSYISRAIDEEGGNVSQSFTDLKTEGFRLLSFKNVKMTISVIRLSSAGFYATGNGNETKCFSCKFSYSGWRSWDNPIVFHRQKSPNCSYLRELSNNPAPNRYVSNDNLNVSVTVTNDGNEEVSDADRESLLPAATSDEGYRSDLFSERVPLDSISENFSLYGQGTSNSLLQNAPAPVESISHSGLRTQNTQRNRTQNGSGTLNSPSQHNSGTLNSLPQNNSGTLNSLSQNNSGTLNSLSQNNSGTLNSLSQNNSGTLNSLSQNNSGTFNSQNVRRVFNAFSYRDLMKMSVRLPSMMYPQYRDIAERLKTFKTWPPGHCKSPEDLVPAGFYFAGYSDCVRCYTCGIGLKTWEAQDDPWEEHVRCRSLCPYVIEIKGQGFVMETLAAIGRRTRIKDNHNACGNLTVLGKEGNVPADILDSEACQRAIEMGFQSDEVRNAALTLTRGTNMPTLEDIVERIVSDGLLGSPEPQHSEGPRNVAQTPVLTDAPEEGAKGGDDPQDLPSVRYGSLTMSAAGGKDKDEHLLGPQSMPVTCSSRSSGEKTSDKRMASLTVDAVEENRQLRESGVCKICLDEPADIVFLPCAHLLCCVTCSPALSKCPLCRKHIRGTVKVHMTNMASVKRNS